MAPPRTLSFTDATKSYNDLRETYSEVIELAFTDYTGGKPLLCLTGRPMNTYPKFLPRVDLLVASYHYSLSMSDNSKTRQRAEVMSKSLPLSCIYINAVILILGESATHRIPTPRPTTARDYIITVCEAPPGLNALSTRMIPCLFSASGWLYSYGVMLHDLLIQGHQE